MKNKEFYRDEILSFESNSTDFCDNFVQEKILSCYGKQCIVPNCNGCKLIQAMWLEEEYKEPEEPKVDWSKVAVDTPILVRADKNGEWENRYFAKYECGKVYAWGSGTTSWSADSDMHCVSWNYAKLAEED